MKTLKNGSRGPDVKLLQTALNKTPPKAKLKVDAIFGDKTEAAVKALQKAKRLKGSGIADADTIAALGLGKQGATGPEWPWPAMEQTIGSGAKIYAGMRDRINAALRIAGKVQTAEMRALEARMLAAWKELDRQFRAQDAPARAVVELERKFLKAKRDNPTACPGIVQKAEKLADASAKATIASMQVGDTIETLHDEIERAASNAPEPRPVDVTRKRQARYKTLRKADEADMKKSLQLCERNRGREVEALRQRFLAMDKEAKTAGNSSAGEIMRRLVELEVLEIGYNKDIRSVPARELRKSLEMIRHIESLVLRLEKGRLDRLRQKAALDKELSKAIKLAA